MQRRYRRKLDACEHCIPRKRDHDPYEQIFLPLTTDYTHLISRIDTHDVRVL